MSIVAECLRDKSQPLSYNFDVIDRDELEPKEIQQVFDAKFKEKPMKREKKQSISYVIVLRTCRCSHSVAVI